MTIQLLFAPLFIIAIFIAFYIPGRLALRKLDLTTFQSIVLSTVLGLVLWGWQGFIFGFLGMRWATYLYLFAAFILWFRTHDKEEILAFLRNPKRFQRYNFDTLTMLLIVVGTILQLTSIFFMGIQTPTGLAFCCAVPDSLYHIALTNQLVSSVPPLEPGAAGLVVHNYHYLGNLISADLIRVFRLPLIATQFQYLTVFLSLLIGLTAVTFGQLLQLKKSYIRWLVFFLYFSGDLTFLLTLISGAGLNFTLPVLENALWLWISPPRVFALVVFLASLSIFILWIKRPKTSIGIILALMLSSLIGLKIYVGIFMAVGIIALVIYYLWNRRFQMLPPLFLTGLLSALLYFPINTNAGGLVFVGHPWIIENFIAQQPALSLQHIEQARLIYLSHHNWIGLLSRFEIWYVIAYFIFVFGTITIGFLQSKRSLALFPRELNIFLLPGFIVSVILGSFFFQQIGEGNTTQFLITIDILGSLYAALACYYWLNRFPRTSKYIVTLLIILLTVPRVIYGGYQDIVVSSSKLIVDNNQLQALDYLKNQTPASSVILVDNLPRSKAKLQSHQHSKQAFTPADTRTWIGDNAYYIGFLADRSFFLDGIIVSSHGGAVRNRISIQNEIVNGKNLKKTQQLLKSNHISYLYLPTTDSLAKNPPSFLPIVFSNATVTILKNQN